MLFRLTISKNYFRKISYKNLYYRSKFLKKLGFERHTFDVLLENMSLGQQKKVQLAASLATPAELYLWDEPLNYLDTYNQDQLLALLQETKPALLVIEHDQNFIDQIADTVVELK